MSEELKVVLRKSENFTYGFSLLGTAGLPHVIYDILENSPAAECGEVEAGDVILKVNGTDVHRYSTKEVLKCLRLSPDPVTLDLKRDPKIKARVRHYLAQTHNNPNYSEFPECDLNASIRLSPCSSPTQPSAKHHLHHQPPQSPAQQRVILNSSADPAQPTCRKSRIPTSIRSPVQQSHHTQLQHSASAPSNTLHAQQPPTHRNSQQQQHALTSPPSRRVLQKPQQQQQLPSNIPMTVSALPTTNGAYSNSHHNGTTATHDGGDHHTTTTSTPPTTATSNANKKQRFEAYMMTGDLILNLSRTQQSSGLIQAHAKKVDSLRDSPKNQRSNGSSRIARNGSATATAAATATGIPTGFAPRAKGESSLSSPSFSDDSSDSINSVRKQKSSGLPRATPPSRIPGPPTTDASEFVVHGDSGETSSSGNSRYGPGADFSGDLVTRDSASSGGRSAVTMNNREPNTNHSYASDTPSNNSANGSRLSPRSTQRNAVNKYDGTHQQRTVHSPQPPAEDAIDDDEDHSFGSSTAARSDNLDSPDACFSVPTSPTSLTTPIAEALSSLKRDTANSVPTSPESGAQEIVLRRNQQQQQQQQQNGSGGGAGSVNRRNDAAGFRTSRSEDHLQHTQRDILGAAIPIDIDEDVNSSLNTLLDTRQDSEDSQSSCDRDRIVWTYNAPVHPTTIQHQHSTSSSHSHSSSLSSSPQRSDSPASPTSVSSSIMSSNSGSKAGGVSGNGGGTSTGNGSNTVSGGTLQSLMCPINNGDHSVSEAVSNISSPDYQDDDNLLSSKDMTGMAISDPSDSDSTILVSDHRSSRDADRDREHKIVIKVKGFEGSQSGYTEFRDSEDELATITEDVATVMMFGVNSGSEGGRDASPPVSDDGSDVDSLHSYHYSPKAVDIPSAVRLAKRLYGLDGFKKSDVSRHLSKNNDFSRAVADEYLKYFDFVKLTLDEALRQFLQQFALSGETQERERVLVHFSRRYLDCNPRTYNSQDAVHTLTCAIMLLNTDLHGQNIGRKMTCSEFIDNLVELNDGENFPKDVLKSLYQAIKGHPLEWALDDESPEPKSKTDSSIQGMPIGLNPFLDTPQSAAATEHKKGYVMRKCCYDSNYKKTPFGKRSWKMFYCTLRDLVLYLHKDEHGFRKNQMTDNVHNAIRIHHALATKAADYTKKQHVFRLHTADQSEYLFQTSDSKELESWIDTINTVCATFSAPPLEGAVGSQKRFQRPLLPSSHTKLIMTEQLANHEEKVAQLEGMLADHKRATIPNKGLPLQNYKEKENYLLFELKRYKTYATVLGQLFASEQDQAAAAAASCYPNGLLGAVSDDDDECGGHIMQQQPAIYQPLTVNLSAASKAQSKPHIPSPLPLAVGQQPPAAPTNRYLDSYGIGAGQHVVMSYDEEEDSFVVDDDRGGRGGDIDLYDEDADDDDDDDDDDGNDIEGREHDRHSEGADIISGGRKATKYFFQKSAKLLPTT